MFIIDFEASSLSRNSYPIEVAWGDSRDSVWSSLISPSYIEKWIDWDIRSQQVHGISKETLLTKGRKPQIVAQKMIASLSGQAVYSDEPHFDSMWKDRLLADSGYDSKLIQIRDLKTYMSALIKCGIHHQKFIQYLRSFTCSNLIRHRAKEDVIWLFDFLEYLKVTEKLNITY